ncbi:MAG: hypothetical protein GTO22_19355 [Gemmatimonadales bacterium]|nr:hypothetical protein [Gemmatimonadales bacterium]
MRTVTYERFEFHQPAPETRTASLAEFVLDVPYLVMHGVIPPRHVLNEVLRHGGGDAGMSPGAGWEPFEIDHQEYVELVSALQELDLAEVARADRARFVPQRLFLDASLDDSKTHLEWVRRVAQKYRDPD